MTPKGFEQVATLRPLLPDNPPAVICGTGRRHIDVAGALGLEPTRYTAAVGDPDSLEVVNGRKVVILAAGAVVQYDRYTTLADVAIACKKVIANLPDKAVVCAGRQALIMLGYTEAKSAAVYKVEAVRVDLNEWDFVVIEVRASRE